MKKKAILIIFIIFVFLSGCDKNNENDNNVGEKELIKCSDEFKVIEGKCVKQEYLDAEIVYSCDSGYTLKNNLCFKTLTQKASVDYTCPDGYQFTTEDKFVCFKKEIIAQSNSLSCPTGYYVSKNKCKKLLAVVPYNCPSGYNPYINGTCKNSSGNVIPYLCPSYPGATETNMSFSSCTYYHSIIPTSTGSCPSGWFSNYVEKTCYRNDYKNKISKYSCQQGYNLVGENCNKEYSISANKNLVCKVGVLKEEKCLVETFEDNN